MIKFGEVLEKFPPELKDAVISFYDFLREEYVIKREEFEELKSIIKSLIVAQEKTEERISQLAIAQEKTEERLNQLAIAQQKTEERLNQLAIAQGKTEERISQLAIAQEKTEERMNQLAMAQEKTEERLNQLAIAQEKTEERINQLAMAQEKTEERLNQLAIAQQKTEERISQLAIAQEKTEERLNQLTERVNQLAEAQRKTEEELRNLTRTVKRIQEELGGISHSIGFDLENQAYKALPNILKERYNIDLTERLLRKFIEYPDGREEEIDIFGKGKKDGEVVYIIGEAKTHLKLKDIDLFKKRLERINKVIPDKKFPLFVVHSSSPRIVKYAQDNGFPVFFSYDF